MLDMSRSMIFNGCFLPAKKVALALNALIRGQFPRDSLYIVGFSLYAREFSAAQLPHLAPGEWSVGTNMHAGFLLARQLLARHKGGNKQVIMITDGEPTAHMEGSEPEFAYPPTRRTLQETLKEVQRCTRDGITINTFMLEQSHALTAFVEQMTRINRGRAFFADVRPPRRVRARRLRPLQAAGRLLASARMPDAASVVLLVRHGLTPTTGIKLPGRAPGLHLSDEGRRQAEAAAERIGKVGRIAAVYCSPITRARETAQPIGRAVKRALRIERDLADLDIGEWTGMSLKQAARRPEWETVQRNPSSFRFPGGESFPEMQTRMTPRSAASCPAPRPDRGGGLARRPHQGRGGPGPGHSARSLPAHHDRALVDHGGGLPARRAQRDHRQLPLRRPGLARRGKP